MVMESLSMGIWKGRVLSMGQLIPSGRTAREPRAKRVIVLEDLNFVWDESELDEIVSMVNKGTDLFQIGQHFKRDPDEVLLAFVHLARKDKIKEAMI